jgi:LAO/AO transport system kinase
VQDLEGMLDLAGARPWRPPVVETVATADRGVDVLVDAIGRHRAASAGSGELATRRERRIADEIHGLVLDRLIKQADDFCSGTGFATVVRRVVDGESDPYTAATLLTGGDDGGTS